MKISISAEDFSGTVVCDNIPYYAKYYLFGGLDIVEALSGDLLKRCIELKSNIYISEKKHDNRYECFCNEFAECRARLHSVRLSLGEEIIGAFYGLLPPHRNRFIAHKIAEGFDFSGVFYPAMALLAENGYSDICKSYLNDSKHTNEIALFYIEYALGLRLSLSGFEHLAFMPAFIPDELCFLLENENILISATVKNKKLKLCTSATATIFLPHEKTVFVPGGIHTVDISKFT